MLTGREIAKRRKALKWSQARLAKAAGVVTDTIVRLEGGKSVKTNTYQDVESALLTGERDLISHGGEAPSLLTGGGPQYDLPDTARMEIRALAARIVEIAKSFDTSAPQATPTTPPPHRPRRRRGDR